MPAPLRGAAVWQQVRVVQILGNATAEVSDDYGHTHVVYRTAAVSYPEQGGYAWVLWAGRVGVAVGPIEVPPE